MESECTAINTPALSSLKLMTTFRNDIIKEVLKSSFGNPKTKVSDEAVDLMTELANILVLENSIRCAKRSSLQNKTIVTLDNAENALPQMMLDFP